MSTRKRRRSEPAPADTDPDAQVLLKRQCRISYHVDERVFDRLFAEDSLEDMRDVVRKKLRLPHVELELSQLRRGVQVDLEDDDDFASLKVQAEVEKEIDILVTVLDAPDDWSFSRAATPAPDFERGRSVAPDSRRGRSVEPSLAPSRRRSVSFGAHSRLAPPIVASLMRAKNFLPSGAAVFDDDDDEYNDDEPEEPTLGQLARRRASGVVGEAGDAMRKVAQVAQDAGQKVVNAAKGAATAAVKRVVEPSQEERPAKRRKTKKQQAEAEMEGVDVSMVSAGEAEAAPVPARDAVEPTPLAALPARGRPKKAKNSKAQQADASDVSMADIPPSANEPVPAAPTSAPQPPTKKRKKSGPPAGPIPDPPVPALLSNPPAPAPVISEPGPPPPEEPNSLVARLLAQEAERERKQMEKKEEKAAKKAGKEKKKQKAADNEVEEDEVGTSRMKQRTSEPFPPALTNGGDADLSGQATDTGKEKEKRGRKAKDTEAGADAAPADAPVDTEKPLSNGGKGEKVKKGAKKNALQTESESEPPPQPEQPKGRKKHKRSNLIMEVVIDVPPRKGKKTKSKAVVSKKRAETVNGARAEDLESDEEEQIREVIEIDDDEDDAPPAQIVPRTPNAFLDKLVESSTPRSTPRRSQLNNSLGFPAQLPRTLVQSSQTPRTQVPPAKAVTITTRHTGTQDSIAEFTQPSQGLPQSLRKILNSPNAPSPNGGKPMRPLSALPRPSLPRGVIANGSPISAHFAVQKPSSQPIQLPVTSTTPRDIVLLPTWTHLEQQASSSRLPSMDLNASQVDQLRSSSVGAPEEISRPNSAAIRELEELEVERATQEEQEAAYDEEDGQQQDVEMDGDDADVITKAGQKRNAFADYDDEPEPGPSKEQRTLAPSAQINEVLGGGDVIGPAALAAYTALSNGAPTNGSQSQSQQSTKQPSSSSLVSYPSLPSPHQQGSQSQMLFRPETQVLGSRQPSQFPSQPQSQPPPAAQSQTRFPDDEELSIFGRASQYIGLSQLSKDKLRQSMSMNMSRLSSGPGPGSTASQSKSIPHGSGVILMPRASAMRDDEDSDSEEDEDEDSSSAEAESILPKDRRAGATRARRGVGAAKFF